MAEYIERDEAVRKALDACIKVVGHGISHIDAVDIAEIMDSIPAADVVEVRHGTWYKAKDGYTRCSRCDSRGSAIKARYCHHCGAKMGGKDNTDG